MISLRRWRSIETKQSLHTFAFLSIIRVEYIYLYENRRIKSKQKEKFIQICLDWLQWKVVSQTKIYLCP